MGPTILISNQLPGDSLLQLSDHSWSCEDLEEILFYAGWTFGHVCLGSLLNTFFKSGENHTQWNLLVIMKAPRKIPVLSEQDFPNHPSLSPECGEMPVPSAWIGKQGKDPTVIKYTQKHMLAYKIQGFYSKS